MVKVGSIASRKQPGWPIRQRKFKTITLSGAKTNSAVNLAVDTEVNEWSETWWI